MREPALRFFEPAGGRTQSWQMPAWIGCFGLLGDGRVVCALRSGLALFDPADRSLEQAHGLPVFRCSDDALTLSPLALPPVRIANGLAFSPDGRTLYHADTAAKTVWACEYDASDGAVANHRVFAHVEEGGDAGGPDGAAVDRDGFYVCAVFGAGCLLRFDPAGRLERRIALPVRYPTMPAFGGDDLATLYLTSASFPHRTGRTDRNPAAGALFALPAPVPGLPTSYMELKERSRDTDRR
jgi:sugar lactone lactonase YvrE